MIARAMRHCTRDKYKREMQALKGSNQTHENFEATLTAGSILCRRLYRARDTPGHALDGRMPLGTVNPGKISMTMSSTARIKRDIPHTL